MERCDLPFDLWTFNYYVINFINSLCGEVNYFASLFICALLTILVATLSYELFEKNILKYKSKFALVKSGKI